MIRYALACDAGHEFESWFPSGESYDAQAARGLVECPICGSGRVEKRLMSPSVPKKGGAPTAEAQPTVPTPQLPVPHVAQPPMTLMSEREHAVRAMLRSIREHVTRNSDYVGTGFADEARRMHYGDIEHRSIYGEADAADAKALHEEGIEVHALPFLPDDRN